MIIKKNLESGQSLLEVVFALVLVGLVVVAIVGLATVSVRNNIYSKNKTLAMRYAQEAIEWVRKKRDIGPWSLFYSHAGRDSPSKYCLDTLGWNSVPCDGKYITGTSFIRELELTKSSRSDTVVAEVTVSWSDGQGNHQSQISSEFTKW
jgi:type II secretory pathway pseudopilin PulG